MKCDFCKLRSEFTCLCEFPFLCSIHLSQHLRQAKNQHIIEPLDICLDTNECQALKNQAQRKIQELQKYKDQTYSLSKILIKKIKKCSKEVTQKIDTQALFYLKLMTLKNLSTSLKAKADKISSSVYVTKDLSLNIEQEIEKVFYQDLFTETSEEEKEDLKKVSEEDKQKKEPQAMNLRFGQYINSWSLDQKRSAIDFEITAPSQTREIRFSKDEKYIFVCRNYIEDWFFKYPSSTVKCVNIYNVETKRLECTFQEKYKDDPWKAREWFQKYPECYDYNSFSN